MPPRCPPCRAIPRGTPGRGGRRPEPVSPAVLACVALVVGERRDAPVLDLADRTSSADEQRPPGRRRGRARAGSDATSVRGLARQGVGDRIVVAVEAQVRRLAGGAGRTGSQVEGMRGQRQETRPLLGQRGGDGALVGVAGDQARVRDGLDPGVELRVEVVEGARTRGRRRTNRGGSGWPLDRPFSLPRDGRRAWGRSGSGPRTREDGDESG